MKETGVCPKCGGADIVRVPGGIRSTIEFCDGWLSECTGGPLYLLWLRLFRGMAAGGRFGKN